MDTPKAAPTVTLAVIALIIMGIGCAGLCSLLQNYGPPTFISLAADNASLFWLGWMPCVGIFCVGLVLGIIAFVNSRSHPAPVAQ